MALCDLLQDAACDTTLDLLVDNEPDVLLNSFDAMFLHRLATFTNAVHVFDEEPQIRASLGRRRIHCDGEAITYRFANSQDEPAIQVSDVLCGILGKHFSCMEKLGIEELEAWRANLSDQQRRNASPAGTADRQGRRGMPSVDLQPGAQRQQSQEPVVRAWDRVPRGLPGLLSNAPGPLRGKDWLPPGPFAAATEAASDPAGIHLSIPLANICCLVPPQRYSARRRALLQCCSSPSLARSNNLRRLA